MPVRHVLVVDDSKSARLMLRKMLQGFGLTVDVVESGEEALNYLREQHPDLVFMDHTMPGMDGLTAARNIHENPQTTRVPVAMYTSKDEPSYRDEAFAVGAIDVLTKPAVPDALKALVDRISTVMDGAAEESAPVPVPVTPKPAVPVPKQIPMPPKAASVAKSGDPDTVISKTTGIPANTITPEWIERIAADRAERVFYEAIESQVLPLIHDVVTRLRKDIEQQYTKASEELATEVEHKATTLCEKRLSEWNPPKLPTPVPSGLSEADRMAFQLQIDRLEERLDTQEKTFTAPTPVASTPVPAEPPQPITPTLSVETLKAELEPWVWQTAKEICKAQLQSASENLLKQVSQRFTDASHKIVYMAKEAGKQAALSAAEEARQKAVAEAAPQPDAETEYMKAAKRAGRQMWMDAQKDLRNRMWQAAGLSGAVSALVAAGVFYLLQR